MTGDELWFRKALSAGARRALDNVRKAVAMAATPIEFRSHEYPRLESGPRPDFAVDVGVYLHLGPMAGAELVVPVVDGQYPPLLDVEAVQPYYRGSALTYCTYRLFTINGGRLEYKIIGVRKHDDTGAVIPSITCRGCGSTSYDPNDIEQRYCKTCHQFAGVQEGGESP